jgi:GT2 family glycosyltransferase
MKEVSVITVNFNQPAVTEALIHSIITYCAVIPEIIVVDNGSTDDPVPDWAARYPQVRFIRSEVNLGFAGGNNLGIRAATGDLLFLVNNDTEFTPGLLAELSSTLRHHPEAGAVCPKIRFFDQPDTIQYAGYTPMNYFTIQNVTVGLNEIDTGQYDNREEPTAFAHGAAMMLKRETIDKAGLMPENFFLYYEEMDWCERIREQGFSIWVNTRALIYHKESVSTGRKSALREFFMNRNRILFARRNSPFFSRCFFYLYFIFLVSPRNVIVYLREGHPSYIGILLRAIWWNMVHRTDSADLGFAVKKTK